MLARLALAIARTMPPARLRRLVELVFVRTRRQLDAAVADPRTAQEQRLRQILGENADTEVGRRFGFRDIQDLDSYRAKVPLCSWDDVAPQVERMVAGEQGILVRERPFFYATTSGTTGRRKLIPVTSAFVEECRVANKLLYRATLAAMPELLLGKRLSMRSPRTEDLGGGAMAGSITLALGGGLEEEEGLLDAVPADVFLVDDFETRYFLALRFALQERVTVCSAINPSTLLLFARVLAEHADRLAAALERGELGAPLSAVGDPARHARLVQRARRDLPAAARVRASAQSHGAARMRDAFPALAGLVCWKGGSAPWYLERLSASYGALPILDYGYCASEGCFGAALSPDTAASVLLPHGHVLELIPEHKLDEVRAGRASTVLLHEARVGERYLVVITTGAGLYRYEMNDVVEITGKVGGAPLAVFRHKGGAVASVTGEKVGESHVVSAMAVAQRAASFVPAGFCVAPVLPGDAASPRYVLALDPGGDSPVPDAAALRALAHAFDAALRAANEEYDAKRASLRLDPVFAALLPAHALRAHRARRVADGAPDAHVKIPHVSPDGRLLLELGLERVAPELVRGLPCRAGGQA